MWAWSLTTMLREAACWHCCWLVLGGGWRPECIAAGEECGGGCRCGDVATPVGDCEGRAGSGAVNAGSWMGEKRGAVCTARRAASREGDH